MYAGGFLLDSFSEGTDNLPVGLAHKVCMINGPKNLLLPAGETAGVAGSRKEFLAFLTEQPRYFFRTLRLVVADAGEGFLALDALGDCSISITHTYDFTNLWHRKAQRLNGLGDIVFVLHGLKTAQTGFVDFKEYVRARRVFVSLAVAAFAHLTPLGQVCLLIACVIHVDKNSKKE